MNTKWIFIIFLIANTHVFANEEMLDYFYVEGVNVNKIHSSQTKEINANYKYVVAYAVNTKTTWKDDTTGIFLVSKNGAEIIDMFHSKSQIKLIPSIRKISLKELIVGIYGPNIKSKKIKYIINVNTERKLVSRIELKENEVPNALNISQASSLADNKKFEAALNILAPCLKITSTNDKNNLEDCLFYGEEIAEKALRSLELDYKNKAKLHQAYGTFENWLSTMGIKIDYEKYAGAVYQHNYIIKLIQLFPHSKYRDVYDYKTLERGTNDIKSVQKWIDSLLDYRSKYPTGRYIFNATVDLANAYDDLWEILTPDPEFDGYSPYYSYFSSGNKDKDKLNAEIYRNNALKLYKHLKMNGVPKGKREEYILQESIERIQTLKERIRSNSFYILND